MAGLPAQPLEVTDFSGGITDNYMQGDPRRYAVADNYLITTDKKLEGRPAIVPIDNVNYILPTGNQRVGGMYTVLNETILLAQSSRKFYVIDPATNAWTPITGPTGNEPLQGGDQNCQTTLSEFQRQVYLTCDGTQSQTGVLPSKLYRDVNNVWRAKTAGLPRAYVSNSFNTTNLLAKAINLANALRFSMINHFMDAVTQVPTYAGYSTQPAAQNQFLLQHQGNDTNLHYYLDKYSLSYLQSVSFVAATTTGVPYDVYVPTPIPTPAPGATDLASLQTLIIALNNAYTWHVQDSLYGSANAPSIPPSVHGTQPVSHYYFFGGESSYYNYPLIKGPGAALTYAGQPIPNLKAACEALDDLAQKWYWHQMAVNTHSEVNDPAFMSRYLVTAPKIGTVQWTQNVDGTYKLLQNVAPTITPDLSDAYNYVNNLKYLYNTHIGWTDPSLPPSATIGSAHGQNDTNYQYAGDAVTLPDCTSEDTLALVVFWLRAQYRAHQLDSAITTRPLFFNYAFVAINFNCVAGSYTITSVTDTLGGGAALLPVGTWVYCNIGFQGFADSRNTPVTSPPRNNPTMSSVARVLSSTAGTAVLDRQAFLTFNGLLGQASFSKYHTALSVNSVSNLYNNTSVTYTPASTENKAQASDVMGGAPGALATSTKNWINLGTDLLNAMGSHVNNGQVHAGVFGNTASPPMLSLTAGTPTQFFVASLADLVYAFFFSDDYVVEPNGIEYLVQGNPVFSNIASLAKSLPVGSSVASQVTSYYNPAQITATRANTITNLPVLTNTTETNYDLTNVRLNIYRSTDGGTTFYKLDQINNGVTTYVDSQSDAFPSAGLPPLNTRQVIYTSGGVVGYDQPPQCKFTHVLNGTVYYAGVVDTGQWFPNRIRQSVPFSPDAAPATFTDDLDDEITGVSSTRANLIVFCKNSIFRMSGGFNSLGQGALLHEKISDTLGCDNAKSIVRTEIGVFFAGFDGFYYTDGFQIIKISLELDKTYGALTQSQAQKRGIWGAYDKQNRRVWWSMRANPQDQENSVSFVFYLDYGVKPSGTFTKGLNGLNFQPASMVFQQGSMFIGDGRGYVLRGSYDAKADSVVTPGTVAANWQSVAIPTNYTSCAMDLGTTFKRKWLTKIHSVGRNIGNAAVQLFAIRDMNADSQGIKPLAVINYTDNKTWGTPTDVWGDPATFWNNLGKNDVMRRFPQTTLRSDFIQIQYVPAKVAVYASSVGYPFGANAVVDAATKTATIQTPAGYTNIVWFNDVVGYVIAFQTDNYVLEFPITALDGTKKIITYADPSGLNVSMPTGVQWVIRGVKKEQRAAITSYVLHYAYLGDQVQDFPGRTSDKGGGNSGENP